MFRKYVSLTMAILVINLACGLPILASGSNDEKEAKFVKKVKTEVSKLGTGSEARVEVKLKDGTKIKGYVTEITDASFTVMNEKTNSATKIPYPQAKQVKGNNLSNGAKFAIAVGIIAGLIAILYFAGRSN